MADTAVRAGFGVFHERYRQNNLNFDGLGNPPLSYTPRLFGGNIDQISPALVNAGVRFPVTAVGVNGEGHPPKIYSWYAGVQRQLPWRFSIDAAYVGNRGVDFAYIRNLNQLPLGYTITNPPPEQHARCRAAVPRVHGRQHHRVRRGERVPRAAGAAHAPVRTALHGQRRLHAVEGAGPRGRRQQRARLLVRSRPRVGSVRTGSAPSGQHRLRLPAAGRGDEVVQQRFRPCPPRRLADRRASAGSGAASRSPSRRTATPGRRAGACARTTSAAICIRPSRLASSGSTRSRSGVLADGTLGTTPKGFLRGPGINQWDISLYKNTRVGERMMVQFRLETFNTFNHVQFNGINTGVNVPNAGPGGDRRHARHARAGDELPRSAPDPGRVEVLLLASRGGPGGSGSRIVNAPCGVRS